MTVQPLGTASLAVHLTAADLREYGLTPDHLTLKTALALTRQACTGSGVLLGGRVELEIYPALCGVLIFARSLRPSRPPAVPPLRGRRARRRPT